MCVANSYNILTTEYYISHAKSQLVNCGYPSKIQVPLPILPL